MLSLKSWLEVANEANVPSIEAEVVAEVNKESLLMYDTPEGKLAQHQLTQANETRPKGSMLRFDACAGYGVKMVMDAEGSLDKAVMSDLWLTADDPRAYDINFAYPGDTIPVLLRPIEAPMKIGSHPLEFRVYIKDGEVKAVSNYYPQNAIDKSPDFKDGISNAIDGWIAMAIKYSNDMIKVIQQSGRAVQKPGSDAEKDVAATLDFLVNKDGAVLFLEGGPVYGKGAHPCCFYNEEKNEVSEISGVKLSVTGDTRPIELFQANRPKVGP